MIDFKHLLVAGFVSLLTGCGTLGYYAQSVQGQLELMTRAQPVDQVLADPATPPELAGQLRLSQDIRAFASEVLKLPQNGSYTEYADLERDTLVWSLVAAPEFSLQPKQWCYPVIGCASYRGYFHRDEAEALARELAQQGYDVAVLPVQAYSTLGWFDDPLTNMVIGRNEADLAAMIFHELAHQRVYVADDSTFNESYASAVEEIGLELWLKQRDPQQLKDWYLRQRRYRQQLELMRQTRAELEQLYADPVFPDDIKREQKRLIFEQLRDAMARRATARSKSKQAGPAAQRPLLNNAHLVSVETYHRWVPAFLALWREQGRDPAAFHAAVEALSKRPKAERDERLRALTPARDS